MKTGVVIVLLCLMAVEGYGQNQPPLDIPKIVPATPNATKITDFYARQPNMYTGTASVSIPLYSINFDGWSLPLSISYNATGIRASEEASEIGLGWALNATGVISRSINGGDDFFDGGNQGLGKGYVVGPQVTTDWGFVDGRDPEGYNSTDEIPESFWSSYYYKLASKRPDTQPDVFNYNFFGYSGSFVLTQQVRGPVKVVKITQDPCLIEFNFSTKAFTVTTPQGFKGTFDVRERSTTVTSRRALLEDDHALDCCTMLYIDDEHLTESSGQFRTITSWYLSRIVSPRGEEIDFTYDLQDGRSHNISATRSFSEKSSDADDHIVCIQTIQEHVYLTAITSDEVHLTFQMATRDDLRRNTLLWADPPESNPLSLKNFPRNTPKLKRYTGISIEGVDPSSLSKSITFLQTYFNQGYYRSSADNENEPDYLRLRLDRVIVDDQKYSFYYEKPDELPWKLTSGIDHFGFANGHKSTVGNIKPPMIVTPRPTVDNYDLADTAELEYYTPRNGREVSLEHGKAGVLAKVVYPTGGYTTYTYESHRYYPENSTFSEVVYGPDGSLAGGMRIKTIKEFGYDDDVNPKRTREYYYVNNWKQANSGTTGKIMTPLFNRYPRLYYFDVGTRFEFIYKSFTAIPGSHAAQGKVIGYSKVHEVVKGENESYSNTYYFENNTNAVRPFNAYAAGTPNLNGQLIETRKYDSDEKVVQSTVNSDYNHVQTGKVMGIVYEPSGNEMFLVYFMPYYLERSFITPYMVTTTTSITPSDIDEEGGHITGIGSSSQITTISTYHDSTRLLKTQSIINSEGDVVKTEYKRPFDYNSPATVISDMKSANVYMIETIIEEITTKNSEVVSARGNEYVTSGSGENMFVNLKKIYHWNHKLGAFSSSPNGSTFTSPYELKMTFDEYDNRGNVRQYKGSDGVVNSFIWGYNNRLPIAHGLNITYTKLKTAHDASQGSNYETAMRSHSNTLNAQVTTYTHDPLVGVKTVANPSGIITTYSYDTYSRLKSIVDNDGKTLEQYEYNFRRVAPVYDVTSSASILDWGRQIPGATEEMLIGGVYYPGCILPNRSVSISNNGTEDVLVEVDMSEADDAYVMSFDSGVLMSGNSLSIQIQFNPNDNLPVNTYNRSVTFHIKDRETEQEINSIVVALKAKLETPVCPSPTAIVDFGTVGGTTPKQFDFYAPSDGNIGYRITGYKFIDSNGITEFVIPPANWEYGVSFLTPQPVHTPPSGCILPGSGSNGPEFPIDFKPQNINYSAPKEAKLILYTTSGCPLTVSLEGWNRGSSYYKHMVRQYLGPTLLEPTMQTSMTTVVRFTNDGERLLDIRGVTASRSNHPFTLSDSTFYLQPGAHKDITVTFAPGLYDVENPYTVTFTYDVYLESGESFGGTREFTVTGKRKEWKRISLNTEHLVFEDVEHQNQTIQVKNVGNAEIEPTIQYAFPATNPTWRSTSVNWNAQFGPDPTPVIGPQPGNNTATLYISKILDDAVPELIRINYVKTGVLNEDDQLMVERAIRRLELTQPIISTFNTITNERTATMTVKNTGNKPVWITGVSPTNTSRFEATFISVEGNDNLKPPPFMLPVDGDRHVSIVYKALDYTLQGSTVTVNADNMVDPSRYVDAHWLANPSVEITPLFLIIRPQIQTATATVKNTGNVPLVIESINTSDNSEFVVEVVDPFQSPISFTPVSPTLYPLGSSSGPSQWTIRVTNAKQTWPSDTSPAVSGSITVFVSQLGGAQTPITIDKTSALGYQN